MVEPTENGLVLQFNVPVRRRSTEDRVDLNLDQVSEDELIGTQADGEMPSTTIDVQRGVHEMGWFTAQAFLGHPTHPLSYLGLKEEDTVNELGNNQIGNLVKIYSGDNDWFYYSASGHREEDIYMGNSRGLPSVRRKTN